MQSPLKPLTLIAAAVLSTVALAAQAPDARPQRPQLTPEQQAP